MRFANNSVGAFLGAVAINMVLAVLLLLLLSGCTTSTHVLLTGETAVQVVKQTTVVVGFGNTICYPSVPR